MFDRLAESSRLEYGPPATRAFVIAALLVIGISLLPGSDLLDIEPWETLEHIIAYAGLAFVVTVRSRPRDDWLRCRGQAARPTRIVGCQFQGRSAARWVITC